MQRIGKKILWIMTGAVFGAVAGRFYYANIDPPVENIPPQILPSPNALDTYRDAFKKLPQKLNPKSTKGSPPLSLAQRQAALKADAEGLRLARLAQTQSLVFPRPKDFSSDASYHDFSNFRSLARLYASEGEMRLESGDERGAMNSYLDAMETGQQQQNSGTLISRLVGVACQAIGRQPIWKRLDSWKGDVAKAGARRLEMINAAYIPMSINFTEEKIIGTDSIRILFSDPKAFYDLLNAEKNAEDLSDMMISGEVKPKHRPNMAEAYIQQQLFLFTSPKRDIIRNYKTYLDVTIAQADLPYAKRGPNPKLPDDPINSAFISVFSQTMFKDDNQKTQNVLLTVALALQAYKAEHGRYPDSLKELCPAYLTTLPADPFSKDGTMQPIYHRMPDKYLLYSVGPDGVDDDGKAIEIGGHFDRPRQKYQVNPDSKGDIVAGKNLF